MARIVSVDKSFRADGEKFFVTMQNEDGSKQQIEVGEGEAKRFQQALKESKPGGPRLLTETLP
jgi:hypothetical protein